MKRKSKIGLPPGTIVYTGSKTDIPIKVTYVEFDEKLHKVEIYEGDQQIIIHQSEEEIVQWYDIRGLHDEGLILKISEIFGVHPLVTEDIADVFKRPGYVEYDDGHFITLRSFSYDSVRNEIESQNISIYFGAGFVLTFQEHEDDVFQPIRSRIKNAKGRIRSRGSDYLSYAIIDLVVDNYFEIIEKIQDRLSDIEEQINNNAESVNKAEIFNCRLNLVKMRKLVVPLREALNQFVRTDSTLIDDRSIIFLKDVYDHVIHIIDGIDSSREIVSGLQDLYISEISLKMNKVMQFLTIITAVFVPLSFLAGLYGMNFEYIPELKFYYGYFILLGVMCSTALGSIIYFKRKKWF